MPENDDVAPRPALRALVVEDEPAICMMTEDMLMELGFEIAGVAGQVEGALRKVDALEYDFVILDMNLEGRPSAPIAEALEARGRPFLFATAYGAAARPERWKHVPVLEKPFDVESLKEAIEAALASRRQ